MTSDGTDVPLQGPAQSDSPAGDAAPRIWQSEEILEGCELVLMEHRGEICQRRVRRQRTLVLNK